MTTTIEVADGIAEIVFRNHARRNAMSTETVSFCLDAIARLKDHPPRALVLRGDQGFCAGSDLTELARSSEAERQAFEQMSGELACSLAEMPCPVIAAVDAFAIGGGLTLAAACDIVVSHSSSGSPRTSQWCCGPYEA